MKLGQDCGLSRMQYTWFAADPVIRSLEEAAFYLFDQMRDKLGEAYRNINDAD